MPTMNAQFFLNTYSDTENSNAPSLNNVRWCRAIDGLPVNNPTTRQLVIPASQSVTLFNQSRTLAQDGTTRYSTIISPFDSAYSLTWASGAKPNFRTERVLGTDATSTVTVTMNGPLMVLTAGTNVDFSTVVPGDYVSIGSPFSPLNMGEFKVLSASSTAIAVENDTGAAEGPITLGAGFATNLMVYSSAGVQVGDSLVIPSGFSPISQKTFVITKVKPQSLEFATTEVLPLESNILVQVGVFQAAKKIVYMETDQTLNLTINLTQTVQVQPLVINNSTCPGIYLSSTLAYSIVIANPGITDANLFVISAE